MKLVTMVFIAVFIGCLMVCGNNLHHAGMFLGYVAGSGEALNEEDMELFTDAMVCSRVVAVISGVVSLVSFIALLRSLL